MNARRMLSYGDLIDPKVVDVALHKKIGAIRESVRISEEVSMAEKRVQKSKHEKIRRH